MTPDDFIAGLRVRVVDSSTRGGIAGLKSPIGRRPSPADVARSRWYNSLSAEEQAIVEEIIQESVAAAVFHFLCVLDGVAAIEASGPKNEFRLMQHAPDGSVTCLNPPDGEMLHDIFNAE